MYGSTYIKQGLYSLKYLTKSIYTAIAGLLIPCEDKCLLYATPKIDEIGIETRDAIRPMYLVGDGTTYIKDTDLASVALTYVDKTTGLEVTDTFDSNGEWIIPTNGVIDPTFTVSSVDYTLPVQMVMLDDGTYGTIIQSSPEGYLVTQTLQPTIPVIEDDSVEGSWYNENGYTVADGTTMYIDENLTTLYAEDALIPIGNGWYDKSGTATILSSIKGRVKYNPTFCDLDGTVNPSGEYIKFDTGYDLAVKADITDVLFDDTDPTEVVSKVLPYEDSVYNDQIFISATNGIIAVYDEALEEPCFSRVALKTELYEYGYDINGDLAEDINGDYAIAPKTTTTVY